MSQVISHHPSHGEVDISSTSCDHLDTSDLSQCQSDWGPVSSLEAAQSPTPDSTRSTWGYTCAMGWPSSERCQACVTEVATPRHDVGSSYRSPLVETFSCPKAIPC